MCTPTYLLPKNDVRNLAFRLALLGLIFFSFPNKLFAGSWKGFRGNEARTGYYDSRVQPPDTAQKPEWITALGGPIVSSPVVSDGVVYIGCRDSSIYALDIQTGEILWKKKTLAGVDATPWVEGEWVFIPSRDGKIYTLNKKNGVVQGELEGGMQLASPLMAEGNYLVMNLGPPYNLLATRSVNKTSGLPDAHLSSLILPQISYSSPAYARGKVVVGANNGSLQAFDLVEGKLAPGWTYNTSGGVYMSTPALEDTVVYFAPGNLDSSVYALSLNSGELLWKSESRAQTDMQKGALDKRSTGRFLGDRENLSPLQLQNLARLSIQDRKKAFSALVQKGYSWNFKPLDRYQGLAKTSGLAQWQGSQEIKTSSVGVGKKHVWVIQKQLGYAVKEDLTMTYQPRFVLKALNKTQGTLDWSFEDGKNALRTGYTSSPLVTAHPQGGEIVFFGWGEGSLYAVHARDNKFKLVWASKIKGDIIASPALSHERLLVASNAGYLYSFKVLEYADEKQFQDSTYFYPNPVRGPATEAYFQFDNSVDWEIDLVIYNSAERPLFKDRISQKAGALVPYKWKLSVDLANGAYFAKAIATNPRTGQKLQKWFKIAIIRQ